MSDEGEIPTLPHYVRPGLRMVFVGYNPGIESARAGHYYAFGGNVFWRQLNASGLVSREVGPLDDALLMGEEGIGFTDMCPRPTIRAEELRVAELREGARKLRRELAQNAPRYAVFSGKGIYWLFLRHALSVQGSAMRPNGAQPERLTESCPTISYVIPSSSGLASKWHAERLELLKALAHELRASD